MQTISRERTEFGKSDASAGSLTVADAVWTGMALLQKDAGIENRNKGFTTERIVEYVVGLHLTKGAQKSIWQHVNQHCVANRKPQPNRPRMLFALGGGVRRLFRDGDGYDPEREGAPTHPEWDKLPAQYRDLKEWYEEEWNAAGAGKEEDPLLALIGTWTGETADVYVARLREGWEGRR